MAPVKPDPRTSQSPPALQTEPSIETSSDEQASRLPNFNDDLPSYFPVHSKLRIHTDSTQVQAMKQVDEQLAAVKKSVDRFLEYALLSPHLLQDANTQAFLDAQKNAYGELLRSKLKLQKLQDTIKAAQQELMENRRSEGDLSLENYHDVGRIAKPNFADDIVAKIDRNVANAPASAMKSDPGYLYLCNIGFILENPEDPLPDEGKDEELAVSGGKISLKDPLSMDYFSEPVMSTRCNHVYENKYIRQQLAGRPVIHCPITGCTAEVHARDLAEDKLMALRIKVFNAREKKKQQRVRI